MARGEAAALASLSAQRIQRFWSKVGRAGGGSSCLLWRGSVNKDGYGRVRMRFPDGSSKTVGAHRVAFFAANGCAPGDQMVLHSCDTPRCCNPAHLRLGTWKDNAADMVARRRQATGVRNGRSTRPERTARGERNHSKLTDALVMRMRSMRRRGAPYSTLGRVFGVSKEQARLICLGRKWRHLP